MSTNNQNDPLKGGQWLFLMFAPFFNWGFLILLGREYRHGVSVVMGLLYGFLTLASTDFSPLNETMIALFGRTALGIPMVVLAAWCLSVFQSLLTIFVQMFHPEVKAYNLNVLNWVAAKLRKDSDKPDEQQYQDNQREAAQKSVKSEGCVGESETPSEPNCGNYTQPSASCASSNSQEMEQQSEQAHMETDEGTETNEEAGEASPEKSGETGAVEERNEPTKKACESHNISDDTVTVPELSQSEPDTVEQTEDSTEQEGSGEGSSDVPSEETQFKSVKPDQPENAEAAEEDESEQALVDCADSVNTNIAASAAEDVVQNHQDTNAVPVNDNQPSTPFASSDGLEMGQESQQAHMEMDEGAEPFKGADEVSSEPSEETKLDEWTDEPPESDSENDDVCTEPELSQYEYVSDERSNESAEQGGHEEGPSDSSTTEPQFESLQPDQTETEEVAEEDESEQALVDCDDSADTIIVTTSDDGPQSYRDTNTKPEAILAEVAACATCNDLSDGIDAVEKQETDQDTNSQTVENGHSLQGEDINNSKSNQYYGTVEPEEKSCEHETDILSVTKEYRDDSSDDCEDEEEKEEGTEPDFGNQPENPHLVELEISGTEESLQTIPSIEGLDGEKTHNNSEDSSVKLRYRAYRELLEQSDSYATLWYGSDTSQRNRFYSEIRKYENRVKRTAEFVHFSSYMPTYRAMSAKQRFWYFYWRTEARKGNYLKTDRAYLYVYFYEIINGSGWENPEDGLHIMLQVWKAYHNDFPELDRLLIDWTFSFAQFHGIPYSMPDFQLSHLSNQQAINDYLIDLHRDESPLKLPFELVVLLCDYSVTGTSFYKDGHQNLMQEAVPRVVALADIVLRKKRNRGLLEIYGPKRTRKQRYYAYQSALCPEAGNGVELSVRAYTASSKLRSYINEVVRYGENSLRKIYGVRGRLRGVSLDEEMGRLIDAFLEKEYNPNKGKLEKENSKTQPKVELDFASIEELRIQSDAVREALNVPEAVEQKELLTDLEEVRSILGAVSSEAKALLVQLYHSDWECEKTDQNAALVREINREANRYLACELVLREGSKWVVEEDYRDELEHIYEAEPELTQEKEEIPKGPDISATVEEPAKSDEEFDVTGLSEEMQGLLEALTPVQKKVLMAVLAQENCEAALEQIAEEEMTMPELLLDELNDTAAQYLDDILVDTFGESPCVLEQYEEELEKAWKGK